MRLLLVSDSARIQNGGANRVVVETCALLAARGHSVAVAHVSPGTPDVDCPTFLLPRDHREQRLAAIRQEFRPDLVHVHCGLGAPALDEATRGPTAVFCHDQTWYCSAGDRMNRDFAPCHYAHGAACLVRHYSTGCGSKSPVRNLAHWRFTGQLLTLRDRAHVRLQVASDYMRSGLLENHFPEDRIDLVPLYTQPIPMAASIQPEPGLILLPSRLVPAKGARIALEALARLRSLSWNLVIAGDGWQRPALERLIPRLGLTGRVRFLGEIPPREMDVWYGRARIVLFPVLRHEPFGLVGIEALAHGRPVVAFGGGGADEWLADGESALRVDAREAAPYADAIARLLGDPALWSRLAAGALRRHSLFQPDAYMNRLLASFERALAAQR